MAPWKDCRSSCRLSFVGASPRRQSAARSSVVVDFVTRGMLKVVNVLDEDADAVNRLMRRYANVPMSLADACLVRIVERTANAAVLTLDSDFRIYRQKSRRLIPLIAPDT